jgi:spermidine/putrescine transport system substrate-binding protein
MLLTPPPRPSGRPTRRSVLRGAAGALLGAAALPALSGCGYLNTEVTADDLPPVTPEIDGDLVYFNWADYVDPTVLSGFCSEYKVSITQANYDSMESMAAKIAAGNKYDIIFPSAKWTQRMAQAGQLRRIDRSRMVNAPAIFKGYPYFADPWYDADSGHSIPFSMYKTGIAWRKDKLGPALGGSWSDLWDRRAAGYTYLLDDEDEVLGVGALRLGYDVNTGDQHRLARITDLLATVRPLLRGFSSDDYTNILDGNAWIQHMWSGDMAAVLSQADDASIYGFETCREGTPINSDCYAIPRDAEHPGTALLFIDYMLRPENVRKNIAYIGYPMPVPGTEEDYRKLVAPFPDCVVTLDDLEHGYHFGNTTAAGNQARDAAWTQVEAG